MNMKYLSIDTLRLRSVRLKSTLLGESLLCDKESFLIADNNDIIITSH